MEFGVLLDFVHPLPTEVDLNNQPPNFWFQLKLLTPYYVCAQSSAVGHGIYTEPYFLHKTFSEHDLPVDMSPVHQLHTAF